MPRYFFDIDDGERCTRDAEGTEYPGAQEACDAAIRTLPEIGRDVVPDGGQRDIVTIVRDIGGRALVRTTLSLRTEWLAVHKG